jgi:hypothetical protein
LNVTSIKKRRVGQCPLGAGTPSKARESEGDATPYLLLKHPGTTLATYV